MFMHKNVFNRTQDTVCYAGVKNIIKGEMENEREKMNSIIERYR